MNKALILIAIAAAFGGVVWMKSQESTAPPVSVAQAEQPVSGDSETAAATASVLLFADPREAEARCGCADVIRLARGAGDVEGVEYREFDPRKDTAEAKRYSVRVSPTVIITGADGSEQTRFEGESGDVIAKLRDAVDALQPEQPAEENRR